MSSRWVSAGVSVVFVAVAVAGAPHTAATLSPRVQAPPGMDVRPESCGVCHPAALATWRTSRHAVAAVNPMFEASWENWPNGWCLQCHAPDEREQIGRLGVPARAGVVYELADVGEARWSDGVACATCHVRDGVVLTSAPPSPAGLEAHPMVHDEALADERVCATCHQFNFQRHSPRMPFGYGDQPAQDTVAEWRSSSASAAGVGCQACHMGERGHGFPGAHDESLVRSLIRAEVSRQGDAVVAVVRAPGAAHRVPTGDPFRRMLLVLCDDPVCVTPAHTVRLRRTFTPDAESWVLANDTTVPPERPGAPAERVLRVDGVPGVRAWRLEYRFGDPKFEAQLPDHEVGYVIASGTVATP